MEKGLSYPADMLPRLRYRYCPLCAAPLARRVSPDDQLSRVVCPACGWVHYPANALGINLIVKHREGIVILLPPGEPAEAPAALPGGHIEYAESPEEAAVREAREETGLLVQVERCLGWFFDRPLAYPGPMLSFVYQVQAVGGALKDGAEGVVRTYPLADLPPISPNRKGSQRALRLYLDSLRGDTLLS